MHWYFYTDLQYVSDNWTCCKYSHPETFQPDFYSILSATIKDILKENAPSNKTHGLTKYMNMDIWVITVFNQTFIRDFYTDIKLSKKK